MMGLEPTTFCMANTRDRSRPFAPVRSNRLFGAASLWRANGSEPERRPSAAIAAIVIVATFNSLGPDRRPHARRRGGRASDGTRTPLWLGHSGLAPATEIRGTPRRSLK